MAIKTLDIYGTIENTKHWTKNHCSDKTLDLEPEQLQAIEHGTRK